MSVVRHDVALKAPCVQCMVTGQDIISGRMTSEDQ